MPERRPITAEDLFRFRLVGDPRLSPDGERVVWVEQRTDREQNKYFTSLWLARADGSEARPFTGGDHHDGSPRWSPDGRWIAFTSDRGETSQLWRIPVDGGEAVKLTSLEEGGIGQYEWSPDGTRIAFNFRPTPPWARKSAKEEREKKKLSTPPLHIRRLHYREEGGGYFGDGRWHVWVLHVETGELKQLTRGETDNGHIAWSPDGSRVGFTTNRRKNPDITPQFDEIRVIRADGGEEELIHAPEGPKWGLAWSPDGRTLAYCGNTDITDVWSATDSHLWVVPAEGGEGRDLMAELDRPAGDATLGDLRSFGGGSPGPAWTPDSSGLYVLVSDRGACHVYRFAADGSRSENLTPGFRGEVASIAFDREFRRVASVVGDPQRPGDVEVAELGAGPLEYRRVSHSNDEVLAELELAVPEELNSPSDGGEVPGWLLRPLHPRGERSPLILYIHGGPHTQYGWCMMHELQMLAARGFAVLYTNPRGSRGYGHAHVSAIAGDWGGPDYRDVMAATEHAAGLPGIDAERVGVTGGSYGGYMTNWIIGHTDRFRCAVTQRSVVNLHSMGGTCDFNFSETPYFGGNTWSKPERLLAQSPLMHLGNAHTPLLILHSEGDLRCPIEQAEQLFAALVNIGCEVEFVRYPREANHGLSRGGPPDLRLDRLERIAGWMERWLMDGEPDAN